MLAPEGFCPHCEYPINPGRCPECGAVVAPEALSKSPASARRKKIRRRVLVVVPLVFIAALGVFLYRAVNWIAIAPTSVLFVFQGAYDQPVGQELFRRFLSGSLSRKQTQALFDPYVDDPLIMGYSKYPADVSFKVPILSRAKLPSSGWVAAIEDWHMTVDGERVDSRIDRPFESEEEDEVARQWIWCPPLSEGRRQLAIDGVATLKVRTIDGISSVLHRRRVQLSRDVEITGELGGYVRAESSPELVGRIKESIAAVAFIDPAFSEKTVVAILYGQPAVTVAGMVLARATGGESGFTPLREVGLKGGGIRFFHLDPKLGFDETGSLDVVIHPDPLVAFHHGGQRYLEGVVRWLHLPIRDDVQLSVPFALNQASVPPTSIVPFESAGEE